MTNLSLQQQLNNSNRASDLMIEALNLLEGVDFGKVYAELAQASPASKEEVKIIVSWMRGFVKLSDDLLRAKGL